MEIEPTTLSDTVRALMRSYPAIWSLDIHFGGCGIRVFSNSRVLISGLSSYYRPFDHVDKSIHILIHALEAEEPGVRGPLGEYRQGAKTRIKEEYLDIPGGRLVRKKETGMLFLFGGGSNLIIGRCLKHMNQVENFINNRYMEWMIKRGFLLLHAAGAVSGEGEGLAIAGRAGRGKSSLLLHLLNRGLKFASNDRLLIKNAEPELRMSGIPKLPRINPGTALNNPRLRQLIPEAELRQLEHMNAEELWQTERKRDVPLHELFGSNRLAVADYPLRALVILDWERNETPMAAGSVNLSEHRDLLRACMKGPGLFFLAEPGANMPDFSEVAYLDILQASPVYRISGGVDFAGAASACLNMLSCRPPQGSRICEVL